VRDGRPSINSPKNLTDAWMYAGWKRPNHRRRNYHKPPCSFLAPPHPPIPLANIPTPTLKERSEPKSHLGPITHGLLNSFACTDHASRRCRHFTPVSIKPAQQTGPANQQASPSFPNSIAVTHPDHLHATHPLVGLSACCYSYIHPYILLLYNYWLHTASTVRLLRYDTTDHWDNTESATCLEHTPFWPKRMRIPFPFLAPRHFMLPAG
jgi:hypothetical protein